MNNEVNVIKINDTNYYVLDKIEHKFGTFIYLSNIQDETDTLIRKISNKDSNVVIPLKNDEEFSLACSLLLKKLVS